jgi:hypothetical protein
LIHGRTSNHELPDDNHVIKSVFEKLQIGRKTEEVKTILELFASKDKQFIADKNIVYSHVKL